MNKVLEKLKSIKHIEIILAAVAVAVMIFIYFYSPSKQKSENENKYDYCQSVTVKLQEAVRRRVQSCHQLGVRRRTYNGAKYYAKRKLFSVAGRCRFRRSGCG